MNLKNRYKRIALKQVLFSLMIVVIYIVGSNITLPGIDARELIKFINSTPNMSFATSVSGLSLNSFSFFSIGLGPWISSLILWRVLGSIKFLKFDNLTQVQTYRAQFAFSMLFGIVQGIGILLKVKLDDNSPMNILTILMVLLGGLALLIWLGNQNTKYGIGGSLIIIMANMSRNWVEAITHYITRQPMKLEVIINVLFWFIGISICVYLVLFFINGQLRLPIMHVLLNNKYATESYLPISVYPAGGMPLMYTFSIDMLLQYIFSFLSNIYKHNQIFDFIYKHLTYDTLTGVLVVIIIMLILNYGFAYVNIDNQDLAERLQKSGDYFPNVYPGKNTEIYLSDKIKRMATVGAIFNFIIIGVPMIINVYYQTTTLAYTLLPMVIMWILLIIEIIKQYRTTYNMGDYEDIMDLHRNNL